MPLNREKLAHVLARVDSSFDAEALNAVRRANEMVKAAGMSWEQVLAVDELAVAACKKLMAERDALLEELGRARVEARSTPDTWVEPLCVEEQIDRCVQFSEFLTAWEDDFITSLAGWRPPLRPKQQARLDELVNKLRRIARAKGLAA